MKIAIFSDVHGNLPAFEKMVKATKDCDSFICLGDLVNYAPWGNECVDLASSLPNVKLLMGNHEQAFIDGNYPGNNQLVQDFFSHTYNIFSRIEVIKNFLPEYILPDYTCVHTINDQYVYPDTAIELDRNYFIGHSHHQFKYKKNGYTLYNVGSVGQNRKYINVIEYAVFYPLKNSVEFKQIVYSIDPVIKKMQELGFPEACVNYYLNKEKRSE